MHKKTKMEDLDPEKNAENQEQDSKTFHFTSNAHQLDEEYQVDEEEREKVMLVDAKMGAEETEVRNCIHQTYTDHFKDKDEDAKEHFGGLSSNYEQLAPKIQKDLKDKGLGDWNVTVGERVSLALCLRKAEKYASWKIGAVNVLIFQML